MVAQVSLRVSEDDIKDDVELRAVVDGLAALVGDGLLLQPEGLGTH
jgi:hypothetical protein